MSNYIDRAAAKAQARELPQTAQVSPKGMTALYCGLTLILNVADYAVSTCVSGSGAEIFSMFVSVFTNLAGWILAAGFALYCMDIRRRERSEYASLFDGFSFAGKIIILNIVTSLFVFLWSLLFVVPGIIAYYRYRFALYNLYEDPELDIMEALNMSKRQTQGRKLELFKLDISYLGWMVLSLLPALYVDGQQYLQALHDPASLLSAGSTLPEILVCGIWSLAVSLFFLPQYQCVSLDYFDAARAGAPDAPDDLGGF